MNFLEIVVYKLSQITVSLSFPLMEILENKRKPIVQYSPVARRNESMIEVRHGIEVGVFITPWNFLKLNFFRHEIFNFNF